MRLYMEEILLRRPLPRGSYLHRIPAVQHLQKAQVLRLTAPVTFFVGENGTGKSTLLEAVAVAAGFNPEGGTKNFHFSTRDTHSPLGELLTLGRRRYPRDGFFLRAESTYNAATYIEELDEQPTDAPKITESYGGVSLHRQSHGESFLRIVQHRLGGRGLYLFDEPEAALSPARQLVLLGEIHRLVQQDSQLIIATHSPMLMAYPGAQLLWFSERGIEERDWRSTDHYRVMKRFLGDPDSMLREVLGDE